MELWVHVSRLPVLHLDRNQWKPKLVVPSFVFMNCQWNSAGSSWSVRLLINILFVTWTAPLYRVPYNIGSSYSAVFRPHGTVGLPLLTIPGGMKLLINLLPTSQKKEKEIFPKGEGQKKKRKKKRKKASLASKVQRICLHPKLYGCMFPGSPCHTLDRD